MPPSHPRQELLDEWSAAERRLALLAVADPDGYVAHLGVVERVVDRLAECHDLAELVDAYAERDAILDALLPRSRGRFNAGSLAGAAWMVRYRQLDAAARRRQIEERIAEARRRGESWVTLWETDPEPPSPPFRPYERMEMRLADGVGLRVAVDIDPDSYQPIYSAETVRLDPRDGSPARTGSSADPTTGWVKRRKVFPHRELWDRRAEALLAELDGS